MRFDNIVINEANIKLTKENFRDMDLLHCLLARGKQILERLRGFESASDHAHVFEGHRKRGVHKGCEEECSIGFDVRQCEPAPERGGDCGNLVWYGGRSRGDVIELKVVQFREHADEEEERVWMRCQTLDAQRSQAAR